MRRVSISAAALALVAVANPAHADDAGGWLSPARQVVAAVDNPLYTKECSGCHADYPPGLLPARSWERIMANLGDHFGDNAELEPAVAQEIGKYLQENAADRSKRRLSQKIIGSLGDKTPLRITEVPYIRREHNEIPARYIEDNPDVRSLAQCSACHPDVAEGTFRERAVRIPGVGRWHD